MPEPIRVPGRQSTGNSGPSSFLGVLAAAAKRFAANAIAALSQPDGEWQGYLRDLLKVLGAVLASHGWIDSAQAETVAGVGLVVIGWLLSRLQRRMATQYIDTALALPSGSTREKLDAIV